MIRYLPAYTTIRSIVCKIHFDYLFLFRLN